MPCMLKISTLTLKISYALPGGGLPIRLQWFLSCLTCIRQTAIRLANEFDRMPAIDQDTKSMATNELDESGVTKCGEMSE